MKMADVTPVPKQNPVRDINKDFRPISLTPLISKLVEEVVIDQFIKPAILKVVDPNQFGSAKVVNHPSPHQYSAHNNNGNGTRRKKTNLM